METPETQPETPILPEAEVCDWYFTFGYGQRLFAVSAGGSDTQGEGIPLDNCYVRIYGDFQTAREHMYRLFGNVWCDQYKELPRVPGCTLRDLTLPLDLPVGMRCPSCGRLAAFSIQPAAGKQAFCGNDDCRIFMWDPTLSLAANWANLKEVDLTGQGDL